MTSIIKVDQIQTAAGGVPTAGDLGLNTTGTVLQTVTFNDTTAASQYLNTTTYAATTLSATITPKFANSKIYINMSFSIGWDDSDNGFVIGRLYRDNSVALAERFIGKDLPNGGHQNATANIAYTDSPNTTSPVVYTLYGGSTAAALDFRYAHYESLQSNSLILQEIAG